LATVIKTKVVRRRQINSVARRVRLHYMYHRLQRLGRERKKTTAQFRAVKS